MCTYCVAGLHEFCEETEPTGEDSFVKCCCNTSMAFIEPGNLGESLRKSLAEPRHKSATALRDVLSTGRHRAAIAKPITDGMPCEWAGLKFAGGGVEPIIGCPGNLLFKKRGQYARHHGPDKSVLNNTQENLHLICPNCHNRWHARNDKYYGDGTGDSRPDAGETWLPNKEFKQHDPLTKATPDEILNNEVWWGMHPLDRKVDDGVGNDE